MAKKQKSPAPPDDALKNISDYRFPEAAACSIKPDRIARSTLVHPVLR
jgi:hypothetical protein